MKTRLRHAVACIAVCSLSAFPALAAEGVPRSPPPDRKATCNQEARGLHGAEREDFVKWCLKQDIAGTKQANAPAPGSQQERMKKCNAQAKERALKGDERRVFMSSCLRS